MKLYNLFILSLLTFVFNMVYAETTTCFEKNKGEFDYYIDDLGGRFLLMDNNNKKPLFDIPEENSVTEDFDLYRVGDQYSYIKSNSTAGRAKQVLMFEKDMSNVRYIHLESSVNPNTNMPIWVGIYCYKSGKSIIDSHSLPLYWAYKNTCGEKKEEVDDHENYENNDILFKVAGVINGENVPINLIALNAMTADNTDISYFGCLSNCYLSEATRKFIGKINNRYIINVLLYKSENKNTYEGYYYYEKYHKKIPVNALLNDGKIKIQVSGNDGSNSEVFEGVNNKGAYRGTWYSKDANKAFPFVLYHSLN